jgi:hypothetical protein
MNANQITKTRRTRIVQSAFATAVALVAFTVNPGTPADAQHAIEGRGDSAKTPQHTISTPCFDVPTPDRWPADAGGDPNCPHIYGG